MNDSRFYGPLTSSFIYGFYRKHALLFIDDPKLGEVVKLLALKPDGKDLFGISF